MISNRKRRRYHHSNNNIAAVTAVATAAEAAAAAAAAAARTTAAWAETTALAAAAAYSNSKHHQLAGWARIGTRGSHGGQDTKRYAGLPVLFDAARAKVRAAVTSIFVEGNYASDVRDVAVLAAAVPRVMTCKFRRCEQQRSWRWIQRL